jgi:NIMA (never in mitosis gene a)-related kinase
MSQKEREQLHAEFSILSSLRHPNIVQYYHRDHLKPTQELHLYMEYCGGGDLSVVIKNLIAKNQYAEEEFVWMIFSQLVTALYRCHYGVDPPAVGNNVFGAASSTKPTGLRSKTQVMILHRDLKPENGKVYIPCTLNVLTILVFLGEDNSVKLGDFGLSKLMQSHDFASTYVGTPFYMSPEICAAERYTLHSDIWSLGCIIYELCARTTPFNAKTHFHLVQKIKEGRYESLPAIYSPELQNVVKSCLKTNPLHRPDTATLLALPIVRLMRKEREVTELGRDLKSSNDAMAHKLKEAEARLASFTTEKSKLRNELDSALRREWEVKARLEIDRQVQLEMEKMQKRFDTGFQARVQTEVEKHLRSISASRAASGTHSPADIPLPSSSVGTSNDSDMQTGTDLSSLSIDSPFSSQPSNPLPPKKSTRAPLARARTQYDSPTDVQMVDPSPMSIASLSLSPRRAAAAAAMAHNKTKNIFSLAAEQRAKWRPHLLSPSTSDDEDLEDDADDVPELPSPTRLPRSASNIQDPFKLPSTRPAMVRQNTMPANRLQAQPTLFAPNPSQVIKNGSPTAARAPKAASPNRAGPASPGRRLPVKNGMKPSKANAGGEEMMKAVMQRNIGGGRTLVELAQARAGGNSAAVPNHAVAVASVATAEVGQGGIRMAARVLDYEREKERDHEVPVWDPERDEMPSPFLARVKKPAGMGYGVGR